MTAKEYYFELCERIEFARIATIGYGQNADPQGDLPSALSPGFNLGNQLDWTILNNTKQRRYRIEFTIGHQDQEYGSAKAAFNASGNLFSSYSKSKQRGQYQALNFDLHAPAGLSDSAPVTEFTVTISNDFEESWDQPVSLDIAYLDIRDGSDQDLLQDSSLFHTYTLPLESGKATVLRCRLNTTYGALAGGQAKVLANIRLTEFVSDYRHNAAGVYEESFNERDPVSDEELRFLRENGFRSIRLPVTWYCHMDSSGRVDPEWLDEVGRIVDRILTHDFYVIVDIHHDTGKAGWIRADAQFSEEDLYRYRCLVLQIAEKFKEYDHRLILEGPNEVLDPNNRAWPFNGATSVENMEFYNHLIQIYVDEVRRTGYRNANRYLLVNPLAAIARNLTYFRLPSDTVPDRLLVGIHDYTILDNDSLDSLRYLSGDGHKILERYPLVLSEFGILRETALDDKLRFMQVNTALCQELDIPMMLWDDAGDYALLRDDGQDWDSAYDSDLVAAAFLEETGR